MPRKNTHDGEWNRHEWDLRYGLAQNVQYQHEVNAYYIQEMYKVEKIRELTRQAYVDEINGKLVYYGVREILALIETISDLYLRLQIEEEVISLVNQKKQAFQNQINWAIETIIRMKSNPEYADEYMSEIKKCKEHFEVGIYNKIARAYLELKQECMMPK
jgi:hypothetical protein